MLDSKQRLRKPPDADAFVFGIERIDLIDDVFELAPVSAEFQVVVFDALNSHLGDNSERAEIHPGRIKERHFVLRDFFDGSGSGNDPHADDLCGKISQSQSGTVRSRRNRSGDGLFQDRARVPQSKVIESERLHKVLESNSSLKRVAFLQDVGNEGLVELVEVHKRVSGHGELRPGM